MAYYLGVDNSRQLLHWKYIKRVRGKNGKYRYYYDKAQLKKDVKDKFNSVWNNPDNIYDVRANNYDSKIAKIKESKEWKDIVARKDPEYCKKQADGTWVYDIDSYLVKKKHPELDAIDDIGNGRKISLNKIDINTTIAGAKDYIKSGQQLIGLAAFALTEKFKVSQGSYKEEAKSVGQSARQMADDAKKAAKMAQVASSKLSEVDTAELGREYLRRLMRGL